jgi:26S proteasome regulatory subunit N3
MHIGNLVLFCLIVHKNVSVFYVDKTHNLIVRLRHNVIRTCFRNINISYSHVSLRDVASKLYLDSIIVIANVENIVIKAIWNGSIDASVDHNKGWMQSKEIGDIFNTG